MTDPETLTDDIERDNAEQDAIHAALQEMGGPVLHGFGAKVDVLRMELEALTKLFKTRDPYAKDFIHRDTSLAIQALREAAGWVRDAASRVPAPSADARQASAPLSPARPPRHDQPPVRRLDFVPVHPPEPQQNVVE